MTSGRFEAAASNPRSASRTVKPARKPAQRGLAKPVAQSGPQSRVKEAVKSARRHDATDAEKSQEVSRILERLRADVDALSLSADRLLARLS